MEGVQYMLLRPERTTLLDLISILLFPFVGQCISLDCSQPVRRNFHYRFTILSSLIFQKLLLYVADLMEWFGFWIEIYFNTLSSNGGFQSIIRRILWGRVGIPDKSSSTFLSLTGNLDKWAILDKNIKQGDSRYDGLQAMKAAKLAYENEAFIKATVTAQWKMEFVGSYDFHGGGYEVNAFVMIDTRVDPETIVISFRGMRPFSAREWCSVFDVSWYDIKDVGATHAGYMEAMGMQSTGWQSDAGKDDGQQLLAYYFLRKKLKEILQERINARFVVTGHSSGGALAVIFLAILAIHGEESVLKRLGGVYTFDQPKVGDSRFSEFMMKMFEVHSAKYFRYVYCNDMVPNLPTGDPPFVHFGACLFYNSFYQEKGGGEGCTRRRGFSVSGVAYTITTAAWGMARSFIIPTVPGGGYMEKWLLKVVRSTGLLSHSLPHHTGRDYNNLALMAWVPAAAAS